MSIGLAGSFTQALTNADPENLTTGLPLNDGNFLFLAVSTRNDVSVFDVTQTGALWTNIVDQDLEGAQGHISIWYAENIVSAIDDISIDFDALPGAGAVVIGEWTGITFSALAVDSQNEQNFNENDSVDSGSVLPFENGDLIVGYVAARRDDKGFTISSSGYSLLGNAVGSGGGDVFDTELWVYWKQQAIAASVDFQGNLTGGGAASDNFGGIAAFFSEVVDGQVSGQTSIAFGTPAASLSVGGGAVAISGTVGFTFTGSGVLTAFGSAKSQPIGILEATLDAIGESDAELAGFRQTRLTIPAAAGATSVLCESLFNWPAAGRVLIDGIAYRYSARTPGTLTGLTYVENQAAIAGLRQDHALDSPVLDVSETFSALDAVKSSIFVDTAQGEALSALGRNLGVPRLPFLKDDDQYREVIKAIAYNPKGTIYGLELALEALVGAGNFAVIERLITNPNTVFLELSGTAATDDVSAGKTYLTARQTRPADSDTALTLTAAPLAVGGVRWKDEDYHFVPDDGGLSHRPSAIFIDTDYPGQPPQPFFTYAGGSPISNVLDVAGVGFRLVGVVSGGAVFTRVARIRPESVARFNWSVQVEGNGNSDGNESYWAIRDGARHLGIVIEAPVSTATPFQVGFATLAGNFIGASVAVDNSTTPFHHFEIRKNGQGVVELWLNGVKIQERDYSTFDATSNHEFIFGRIETSVNSLFGQHVTSLGVYAHTPTDYWAARGVTGQVVTANPQQFNVNVGGFFVAEDLSKQLRITSSPILNGSGGDGRGRFEIASVDTDELVTLTGPLQAAAAALSNTTRITVADLEGFTWPQDLGKEVVISGSGLGNDGTYVITDLLDPTSLTSLSLVEGAAGEHVLTTSVAEASAASFTTESNLDYRLRPVFVTDTAIGWELSDAGSFSGSTLTLRQPLPLTGFDQILDVLAVDVLSAHLLSSIAVGNSVVQPGPPALYDQYPAYLSDPIGFLSQYLDALTAAGVIPEFEVT